MTVLDRLFSFFKFGSLSAHIIRGRKGEKLAGKYLEKKGFKILETNFKVKGGEADLVAEFQGRTVVVEVKTRTTGRFGPPQSAVNRRKFKRLVLAGTVFCRMKSLPVNSLRIDVIAIEMNGKERAIRHFENISAPS